MQLQTGMMIRSTDEGNDPPFDGAIVLITEVNNNGATGFVVNKPFHRALNELVEFRASPPFPLYDGGPVDREHLFFIHQRPDLIPGGTSVGKGIYMGGDFKQALVYINSNTVTINDIRIFIGYCGWDAGELEAEINEGSWLVVEDVNFFPPSS